MKQIERLMMDPCISAQIADRLRKNKGTQPGDPIEADEQRQKWCATVKQMQQLGKIPVFTQLEQLLNVDGPVALRM